MRSLVVLTLVALCSFAAAKPFDEDPKRFFKSEKGGTDESLANVTKAAGATKTDVHTLQLADAAKSADKLKKVTDRAEEAEAISHESAADIKKTADKIKTAAASGDHATAMEHVAKLQNHVDEAVVKQKGPEVAEKLKKADIKEDKPVLSTHEDEKILRAAVAEVVEADQLVPPEKKEEATNFAVNTIKDGFKSAGTTHGELVAAVEAEAAKLNKTSTDREEDGNPGYSYGYGYPSYSNYYPEYNYGYGYRQCLYYSSWPYCQRRLYGDYAYYHGFHHFFHNHGFGHHGGHHGFGHHGGGGGHHHH